MVELYPGERPPGDSANVLPKGRHRADKVPTRREGLWDGGR
jgi:hypothetical protein